LRSETFWHFRTRVFESHYTVKCYCGKFFLETWSVAVTSDRNIFIIIIIHFYFFRRDKHPRIAFESNFWNMSKLESFSLFRLTQIETESFSLFRLTTDWDLRWRPMDFSAFIWSAGTRPIWNFIIGNSGLVSSSQPGQFVKGIHPEIFFWDDRNPLSGDFVSSKTQKY